MESLIRRVGRVGSQATMVLNGHFDLNSTREFRDACRGVIKDAEIGEIVVDFSDVSFVDSMALGMLIALRELATAASKSVVLANGNWRVRRAFDLANFGKMFSIR